jgi:hypothetical protein
MSNEKCAGGQREGSEAPFKTVHVGVGGRGEWPLELFRGQPERWRPVALVDVNRETLVAAAASTGLDGRATRHSMRRLRDQGATRTAWS